MRERGKKSTHIQKYKRIISVLFILQSEFDHCAVLLVQKWRDFVFQRGLSSSPLWWLFRRPVLDPVFLVQLVTSKLRGLELPVLFLPSVDAFPSLCRYKSYSLQLCSWSISLYLRLDIFGCIAVGLGARQDQSSTCSLTDLWRCFLNLCPFLIIHDNLCSCLCLLLLFLSS